MCGQCCANQDLVQLTAYELYRLARHLGLDPVEFFNRYCELGSTNLTPFTHLYIRTNDMACPFLNGNLCSVHEARPYACRAYPMRAFNTLVSGMKEFIRAKYPMIEATCSIFRLNDGDVLAGDLRLLTDQTISYWVDDIYFNMICADGKVDLSIPHEASEYYIANKEVRDAAAGYLKEPESPPANLTAERAYARIAMALQSIVWGTSPSFIREPASLSLEEDTRIGKYLLMTTDADSVKALRALVESGSMDLSRTFVMDSRGYPDRLLVSTINGSSVSHVAIGFSFDIDKIQADTITQGGRMPLYVFFRPEDDSTSQAVGFCLNVSG